MQKHFLVADLNVRIYRFLLFRAFSLVNLSIHSPDCTYKLFKRMTLTCSGVFLQVGISTFTKINDLNTSSATSSDQPAWWKFYPWVSFPPAACCLISAPLLCHFIRRVLTVWSLWESRGDVDLLWMTGGGDVKNLRQRKHTDLSKHKETNDRPVHGRQSVLVCCSWASGKDRNMLWHKLNI